MGEDVECGGLIAETNEEAKFAEFSAVVRKL